MRLNPHETPQSLTIEHAPDARKVNDLFFRGQRHRNGESDSWPDARQVNDLRDTQARTGGAQTPRSEKGKMLAGEHESVSLLTSNSSVLSGLSDCPTSVNLPNKPEPDAAC